MISFNYECNFHLNDERAYIDWISEVITTEKKKTGSVNYIFCNDNYLLPINKEFLNHDTLTDIISFDYSLGNEIHGDIYISIERVRENAILYNVEFLDELNRVMIHGILHYCGYDDKSPEQKNQMRRKEDKYLKQFR